MTSDPPRALMDLLRPICLVSNVWRLLYFIRPCRVCLASCRRHQGMYHTRIDSNPLTEDLTPVL